MVFIRYDRNSVEIWNKIKQFNFQNLEVEVTKLKDNFNII